MRMPVMIKKLKYFLAAYAAFAAFAYAFLAFETMASVTSQNANVRHLEDKALGSITVFQSALKKELMGAMQKGGPKAAVEICNEKAPQIAEKVGLEENVTISRTSLKVRNPDNQPNDWEKVILDDFEKRKSHGEALNTMSAYQYDGEVFTYMKPIPMMGMCASCHGANVPKPLYEHINKFYPNDKAIGFKPGDIRGAFVVKIKQSEGFNE